MIVLRMAVDGNWPDGLGSVAIVFLSDLWFPARGIYFDSLRKYDFHGGEDSNREIEGCVDNPILKFTRWLARCNQVLIGGNRRR